MHDKMIKLLLTRVTCLCLSFFISGCGWQLRGVSNEPLPQDIQLSSADRLSAFSSALAENFRSFDIKSTQDAPIKLFIGKEQLRKRTVAVTNIGTAAQYELRMNIPYRFSMTAQTSQPIIDEVMNQAYAVRLFDFETGTNLSKTQEERLLLAEMRNEIALFIIQESRRFSSSQKNKIKNP